MSRDPYAKALRVKPQQVIGDKRGKALREIWNEEAARGILPAEQELLDKLTSRERPAEAGRGS